MDSEMWMIIGGIVLFVFVASFFKKTPDYGDTDYDRRITSDVGVDSSDTGSSDSDSSRDD